MLFVYIQHKRLILQYRISYKCFIERRGSGIKKIRNETARLFGYTDELVPEFRSARTEFHTILMNMNYNMDGATNHVTDHVTNHVAEQDARIESLIEFCATPKSREEMQDYLGISNRGHFSASILRPLLLEGKLKMTIPDKPKSVKQKYIQG